MSMYTTAVFVEASARHKVELPRDPHGSKFAAMHDLQTLSDYHASCFVLRKSQIPFGLIV
jgi:hypothetical protein